MLRSLIACLLASTFLTLELSAVDNSSTAIPIANRNSSKEQIIFTATVDTAIIVFVGDGDVFTPQFTYSREDLSSLPDSSEVVVGFNSCWMLKCRNVKVIQNESFFTLPEMINFIVHSPAKLGIGSYPDTIDMQLIVQSSDDKNFELDLYAWFEYDKEEWQASNSKKLAKRKKISKRR